MGDLLLGRSETAAVYLAYVDAFPSGFELEVNAITVTADHGFGGDVFASHGPLVGEKRDEIPPQLLRVGVQFANGRKATNVAGHDRPAAGPIMWPLRGGSSGGRFHQGYWVSPLPTSGPVAFVCEWPAAGIQLVRHEVDAQLILDAADRSRAIFREQRVLRDGRDWRLGTDADVAWINDGTSPGTAITAAIPPIFDSYCTLALPRNSRAERARHEQAVIELLSQRTGEQPWWLGYLDTGASDVVFPYAPRATVYYGYGYVLVEAGPQQPPTGATPASIRRCPT